MVLSRRAERTVTCVAEVKNVAFLRFRKVSFTVPLLRKRGRVPLSLPGAHRCLFNLALADPDDFLAVKSLNHLNNASCKT
ncbi:hypothetical protein SKAU_G00339450 [Synaphobranchus kaupii]|uniref:Uncharacterized protein n=1 Tax=Synaphobranchus kaupii TaxID=118154 RepID=A0A9Q1IJD9_SYNKA|nr:hypothetical protein SKAU_G00339450 [Synaphobranchus kaupii]